MPSPPSKKNVDEIEASPKSSNNSSSSSAPQSPYASNMVAMMPRTHQSCHAGQKDGPLLPDHVEILPKPKHVAGLSSEIPNNNDDLAPSKHHHPSTTFHTTTSSSRPQITCTSSSSTRIGVVQSTSSAHSRASISPASITPATFASVSRTELEENLKKMSVDKLVPDGNKVSTPTPNKKRKRSPQKIPGTCAGRWTREEHQAFLEGLKECGREWKRVAQRIPTRTSAQIRSHAQKYFAKLQRDQETLVDHNPTGAVLFEGVTPSVQRNIDRILANPTAAEREVETTMQALRERYRQLHLRMQQRQQLRRQASYLATTSRYVEPEDSKQRESIADEHSSVSSTVSSAVASMANEELIALHVLGESLSRGDASIADEGLEEGDKKEEQASKTDKN